MADIYTSLAGSYQSINESADYDSLSCYLSALLDKSKIPVQIVLDLACGTGRISDNLARMGYDVIGVDASPDMLNIATKQHVVSNGNPLYLCQNMQELDLYGTIDACVCCMDSINYLLYKKDLLDTFKRVSLFLMPRGLFIFDVVTPYHYEIINGESYIYETETGMTAWQCAYDKKSKRAEFQIDIFSETEGSLYDRKTEFHEQRCYTVEELKENLLKAGFEKVKVYGNRNHKKPNEKEERIFIIAENNSQEKQTYVG